MPKADRILTELANFIDPRSYVRRDGSEVLYKEDWENRKAELQLRSGGRCEYNAFPDEPDMRCGRDAADPHHKTLRSIRRDDRLHRLLHVCRMHHDVLDAAQRKVHGKNKIHFDPEAPPVSFPNLPGRKSCEDLLGLGERE